MKLTTLLTIRRLVIGCLCTASLSVGACADGPGMPTTPSAVGNEGTVSQLALRSGDLHVTKECSEYTFLAGSFCTITSSNIKGIEVGSTVVYARAAGATSLDSDIVVDPPGPGNNTAFGHCALDFATGVGLCTFSGGTGKFTHFRATANVSYLGGPNWGWEGSYSFSPSE